MNPPKRPASNPRNFSDLPNGAHYLAPMPPTLSGQGRSSSRSDRAASRDLHVRRLEMSALVLQAQALVAIAEGDLPAGVEYAVKAARCIMALRDLGELGP